MLFLRGVLNLQIELINGTNGKNKREKRLWVNSGNEQLAVAQLSIKAVFPLMLTQGVFVCYDCVYGLRIWPVVLCFSNRGVGDLYTCS